MLRDICIRKCASRRIDDNGSSYCRGSSYINLMERNFASYEEKATAVRITSPAWVVVAAGNDGVILQDLRQFLDSLTFRDVSGSVVCLNGDALRRLNCR